MIQLILPQQQYGGVFDFSLALQARMGADVELVPLSEQNSSHWEIGPEDSILLQMSGYGFHKRGAPLWLLRLIEHRRGSITRLGIFFHELYALGPPWSSSFWLSPVQRYICSRLALLSDFWATNREGAAQWLRQYAGEKPHVVLPVFSTVGESPCCNEPRLPRVIIFGSPALRQATYQTAGRKLFRWAEQAGLEIHDIGAPMPDLRPGRLSLVDVVQHGRLAMHDIAPLIAKASFGLLTYPASYVAKSSVFAAYCAHGICPVLMSNSYEAADGLLADEHYFPGLPEAAAMTTSDTVRRSAWEWYQPHKLECHVNALAAFVR